MARRYARSRVRRRSAAARSDPAAPAGRRDQQRVCLRREQLVSRAADGQLIAHAGLTVASRATAPLTVYAWPMPIVVCAWSTVRAATAAEALEQSIAAIAADLGSKRLPPPIGRAIVVGTQSAAIAETVRFANEIAAVGAALVNPGLFPPTVM